MKLAKRVGAALAATLLCMHHPADAQDASSLTDDRDVGVMDRKHPELEPYGIQIGSFIAKPSITVALAHDDNIYAQETDRRSDTIILIQPALSIMSDWTHNAVNIDATLARNQYLKASTESVTNYSADAGGRLDIAHGSVNLRLSTDGLTEARTVVDALNAARRPIRYHDLAALLSATRQFGRFQITGSVDWHHFRYRNATSMTGATLDQSYRNRDTITGEARIEYAITPVVSIYLDGTANQRDYASNPLSFGRNSHGYTIEGGADFDISRFLRGHVQFGYLSQTAQSAIWTTKGFSGRGKIEWFATPVVTVTVEGGRSIKDSALSDSAAYVSTDVSLRADYELLRSLILSATGSVARDHFEGIGQNARQITAGFEAQYKMGRHMVVDLSFQRIEQHTPQDSGLRRFDDNRATLSLRFQI